MSTNEATNGSQSPYQAVDARLREIAQSACSPPPWYDACIRLGPTVTEEERLAAYQAVRRAGALPEAATFWLVSSVIDDIATRDADGVLADYEARLRGIEETYGLGEGGVWPTGTAPGGYAELREQYYRAWDDFFAAKLEEFGEHAMAQFFRGNRRQFEQRSEEGRRYFYPDDDEELVPLLWLKQLVGAVAGCMTADSPMGPLGYRYGEDEGCWGIDIYPTPIELIGGCDDGEILAPGFTLDTEQLRRVFQRVDTFVWQSLGLSNDEGPRLIVEGRYQDHDVLLQVLAFAPEDEEPGMKLDTTGRGL